MADDTENVLEQKADELNEEAAEQQEAMETLFEDDPDNILHEGERQSGSVISNPGATPNLFDEVGFVQALEEEQRKDAETKKGKGKKKQSEDPVDEGGQVRFNNMQEAEKETRKLQSERDSLQSELAKAQQSVRELDHAQTLLKDIEGDPKLLAGLQTYYKTGAFGAAPAPKPSGDDWEESYGEEPVATTEESEDERIERKVNERIAVAEKDRQQKEWFSNQRKAFQEAHPDASDEDFEKLVQFAGNPQNVTMENLWTLQHLPEVVEERAKQLAERVFRKAGTQGIRPSISGVAGAGKETEEDDPQTTILKEIMHEGRKEAAFD